VNPPGLLKPLFEELEVAHDGKTFCLGHVLGPVPGVDVMAKRSQGWVKCEDRLPYYRNQKQLLQLTTCHDSTTTTSRLARTSLSGGGGARGPGPARAGLLRLQCRARALFGCSGQLRSK
jgi:hypothetical protein